MAMLNKEKSSDEKSLDMLLSQYEMLSKSLNDMILGGKSMDSVNFIRSEMDETISSIANIRKRMERSCDNKADEPRVMFNGVDSNKFRLRIEGLEELSDIVNGVTIYRDELTLSIGFYDGVIASNMGNEMRSVIDLVYDRCNIGTIELTYLDEDGSPIYTEEFLKCAIDDTIKDVTRLKSSIDGEPIVINVQVNYESSKFKVEKEA